MCVSYSSERRVLWSISELRFLDFGGFDSEQNIDLKGWSSQAHREFPGNVESTNLSRDNLSREIDMFCYPCFITQWSTGDYFSDPDV